MDGRLLIETSLIWSKIVIESTMSTQQQQEEYLNRVRAQIQAQTIQEIMNKMTEKCFKVSQLATATATGGLIFFALLSRSVLERRETILIAAKPLV